MVLGACYVQSLGSGRDKKSVRYKKFPNVEASLDSRWFLTRLEFTAEVIVDALREKRVVK